MILYVVIRFLHQKQVFEIVVLAQTWNIKRDQLLPSLTAAQPTWKLYLQSNKTHLSSFKFSSWVTFELSKKSCVNEILKRYVFDVSMCGSGNEL